MLSQSSAQIIVEEIGKLVNQSINVMDMRGTIIASTNKNRIGQLHLGAKKIIENNLEELFISKSDIDNFDNFYLEAGLNLPLIENNDIIGVLGITGEYDEVVQIGKICKKMAEILVMEQEKQRKLIYDRKEFENFLNRFLNIKTLNFTNQFIEEASIHRFELKKNYAFITIKGGFLNINYSTIKNSVSDMIISTSKRLFRNSYVSETESGWAILIPLDKKLNYFGTVVTVCHTLCKELKEKFKYNFYIGISKTNFESRSPWASYQMSLNAMHIADIIDMEIMSYDDLMTDEFVCYIPKKVKFNFLSKFFNIQEDEIDDYVKLFESYFNNEGSISSIANELYIHPNTVQYRLNKFYDKTGYDIRKPSQTHFFYFAILFSKEQKIVDL